jgi:YbgC/YbaW family acyl-CoA thioester hydrolase
MVSIKVDIDDTWVEPVYEHVHHGRCLSLFEQARCALLEHIGFPNEALLQEGKVLVITSVQATYKREVKRGVATITCDRVDLDGRTLVIYQRLLNERGKVAVEARIESVFMDNATRRGMNPPDDFLEGFLQFRDRGVEGAA